MKKLGGVSWPRKHTMSARSQGGCHFLRYTDPEAYAQPSKCPCAQVVRVNWCELKRQWLGLCCLMIVWIVDSFLLMAVFERWLFCYKINNFWVCTVYKINMHFHFEKMFHWMIYNKHPLRPSEKSDFRLNMTLAKKDFLTPQTTPFGQLYDAFWKMPEFYHDRAWQSRSYSCKIQSCCGSHVWSSSMTVFSVSDHSLLYV